MVWWGIVLIVAYVVAAVVMADFLIRDTWALRGELEGQFKWKWCNNRYFRALYVLAASFSCGLIWWYILLSTLAHNWLNRFLKPPPEVVEDDDSILDHLDDPDVIAKLSEKIWGMR